MNTKKLLPEINQLSILLDSIYCLHRIGDHESAGVLEAQSKSQFETCPMYKSLGQLVHLIGKYHQNIFSSEDCTGLTNLHDHVLLSGIPLYMGWIHFLKGHYLKEKSALDCAVQSFKNGEHHNELLEVYYWMDKFRVLPIDEKIHSFLRLYPARTIYSRLLGNTYHENELIPQTALEKIQMKGFNSEEENHFDCWLIQNKHVMPAFYKSISLEEDSFLDLYSGLINDRGEYAFLLISELNCLSFLIASQLTGTNAATIAEFLNRTEEEAEALIASLKKMGIPVYREKKLFSLDWKEKPSIIIPRSLKVIGLQEFVKKKKNTFTKAQLIELLQLTQFGAEALLRKWALAGYIRPVEGSDKTTVWKFI